MGVRRLDVVIPLTSDLQPPQPARPEFLASSGSDETGLM